MGSVMGSTGCKMCGISKSKHTTESVNEKLSHRGISLTEAYIDGGTYVRFKCNSGHIWSAQPRHVLHGRGCPDCYGNASLNKELINERLLVYGIKLIGEYVNARTETEFECELGHIWRSSYGDVQKGRHCTICAKKGYNKHKQGFFYILKFGDFIKYGISNNTKKRLRSYKRIGDYEILRITSHENGEVALNLERAVKNILGGRFAPKEKFPDGYTETLSISLLPKLMDLVNVSNMMDLNSNQLIKNSDNENNKHDGVKFNNLDVV
jgi:hypothetical protein